MAQIKPLSGTLRMVALVRDSNGNPKIDDPENCPIEILNLLTETEREALNNGNNNSNSNT